MIKNNNKKYDANFTAGGILFNEFTALKKINEIKRKNLGLKEYVGELLLS